ncbi:prepilin peptidase [Siminovitchia sediminis]|uniref:Prepilin peptidase n=1 Tax=Siminovitchia sediminis TaxID=1274353 RepID=A0ABW4KFQ6_9BACI
MIFIIFIYGLLFGSFFNVAGLRVPMNQSVIKPGSSCPKCHKSLSPIELIPVISFVVCKGKCRHCSEPISYLYPLIELLTGILFVMAYLHFDWTFDFLIACTLISLFMIITVTDICYMLIPDKILIVFTLIFLIVRFIDPLQPWWDSITGAAAGFGLLLLIAMVSRGAMGGGDIKLFAVLGLVLGTKLVLLSFFLAVLFGALAGGIGLMTGMVRKREPIPFGPFIGIGTLAAYFYHHEILAWYLSFF